MDESCIRQHSVDETGAWIARELVHDELGSSRISDHLHRGPEPCCNLWQDDCVDGSQIAARSGYQRRDAVPESVSFGRSEPWSPFSRGRQRQSPVEPALRGTGVTQHRGNQIVEIRQEGSRIVAGDQL
jgi:hypothetical protein